jgi:glutamine phosphoribosylpyrophosphate amidotransferase
MCGVIYFQGDSQKNKELVLALFKESQVRGVHAFGVAIRNRDDSQFLVARCFDLIDVIEFLNKHDFYELIGHCRYDTSGDWQVLENNQPIVVGRNLLAFNGVVRMSTREQYQEEFKREYTTENDGEIPLRMYAEGDELAAFNLLQDERVSFSGVVHVDGRTLAIRNERRPLWEAQTNGNTRWVFSTLDIWQRACKSISSTSYLPVRVKEILPMEVIWLL